MQGDTENQESSERKNMISKREDFLSAEFRDCARQEKPRRVWTG